MSKSTFEKDVKDDEGTVIVTACRDAFGETRWVAVKDGQFRWFCFTRDIDGIEHYKPEPKTKDFWRWLMCDETGAFQVPEEYVDENGIGTGDDEFYKLIEKREKITINIETGKVVE